MQRYFGYARQLAAPGTLIATPTITVYQAGTLTLATIYEDTLSTPTPKANPFQGDATGFFAFYAAPGRYDVRISGGTPAIPVPYTWGDIALTATALTFNASDYGYVADAAVDNAGAISRTIVAAQAAGGGTVWIPAGSGGLGSQVVIPNGILVRGMGMDATRLVRLAGFSGGLPTMRAQGVYLGLMDIEIDNNNVAGDGLRIFGGNYGYFQRLRITHVDSGACCTLAAAGSNKFVNCIFHADAGQCFTMDNGAAVTTQMIWVDVECISDASTNPAIVLDGALNFRSFGGAIQPTAGPGLKIQNSNGLNFYALYVETVAAGMRPVEVADGASDVCFHGGTFNTNQADIPCFTVRSGASRFSLEGWAEVTREGAGVTTPLIDIATPAAGLVAHTIREVTFRAPVAYTAIKCTGTVPAVVTFEQLYDRGLGAGSISVKARDSRLGQTIFPIELLAGSLQPVTLDGCRGALTDPDFAANAIGRDSIGMTHGSGSPEGVVVANLGQQYINTAGGVGTTIYVKRANAGFATGWFALG